VTQPQLKTLPIGEDFMFYEREACEMQQLSRKYHIFKSFNIHEDVFTFNFKKWVPFAVYIKHKVAMCIKTIVNVGNAALQ